MQRGSPEYTAITNFFSAQYRRVELTEGQDEWTYLGIEEVVRSLGRLIGDEVPCFDADDSSQGLTTSPTNPYAQRRWYKDSEGKKKYVYEPSLARIQDATEKQLPRYPFRATHDGSGGTNDEGHYRSQAMRNGLGRTDFSLFSHEQICDMLRDHQRQAHFDSHFISFTDSVIVVLGRALKLWEKEGISNVKIHIIDLTKLKSPILIMHAYAALRGY
jgi:hypothetical protein